MFDISVLNPAAWAAAGAVGGKLVDMFVFRQKTAQESAAITFNAVNSAQKQLVDSLFEQVKMMNAELTRLNEKLAHCEQQHTEAAARVDSLQREVLRLRASMPEQPPQE